MQIQRKTSKFGLTFELGIINNAIKNFQESFKLWIQKTNWAISKLLKNVKTSKLALFRPTGINRYVTWHIHCSHPTIEKKKNDWEDTLYKLQVLTENSMIFSLLLLVLPIGLLIIYFRFFVDIWQNNLNFKIIFQ